MRCVLRPGAPVSTQRRVARGVRSCSMCGGVAGSARGSIGVLAPSLQPEIAKRALTCRAQLALPCMHACNELQPATGRVSTGRPTWYRATETGPGGLTPVPYIALHTFPDSPVVMIESLAKFHFGPAFHTFGSLLRCVTSRLPPALVRRGQQSTTSKSHRPKTG